MRKPCGSSIPARHIDLELWRSRLLVLFQLLLLHLVGSPLKKFVSA
jgi:hypothetical protein